MIEQEIANRYKEQKMRCPVHLSIGQEAAAVGVASALNKTDKMVSTHRGHAHYLAKGGSLKGLIGELYGKSTGCSRGNGGSMHLIDLSCGFHGSTSIVGGTISPGVGLAFSDRLKKQEHTTVICVGDAAIEEGVFHEAANFASLHRLKVIFVCENNGYSCYTHIHQRQPNRPLKYISKAHKLTHLSTRPDVWDIYSKTKVALYLAKAGPVFLEIPTYRLIEHCGPETDDHLGYRPKEEVDYWKNLDPLSKMSFEDSVVSDINAEIEEAFAHAEAAPFPAVWEIGEYVYAN